MIQNPILRGFNPDPSILRVEDDFYIATSTFEWFPGVRIHHSKDLVHWRLLTHVLTRSEQIQMQGNPCSGGVWAPALSYSQGIFYVTYTDVKTLAKPYKDPHNYLTTATEITGPWSNPIYLNSSGFDPSLFHDEDGRKWLVNMRWDHRKGKNRFWGIILQEYSVEKRSLVGPIYPIFKGSSLGCTEGPHIYKVNGYYYLFTAEGGTGYRHAVSVARSQSLTGPYELDPQNPVLTSADNLGLPLQRAGHGSLVQTQAGEWYLAHLCSRPLMPQKRSCLGRETALQKCYWNSEGWLRLVGDEKTPKLHVEPPKGVVPSVFPPRATRDHFDGSSLDLEWSSLRIPIEESWCSVKERPGFLRLRGRESLNSRHQQSLLGQRLTSLNCDVETCLEFQPETYQQMAGLIFFYNVSNLLYFRVMGGENGKTLGIITHQNGNYDELLAEEISMGSLTRIYLRGSLRQAKLELSYSGDGKVWNRVGPELDLEFLSDEGVSGSGYTGTFVALCAQDLAGKRTPADFDYFEYREVASDR
jgi:xylan 1,4-beta-xylosidase